MRKEPSNRQILERIQMQDGHFYIQESQKKIRLLTAKTVRNAQFHVGIM